MRVCVPELPEVELTKDDLRSQEPLSTVKAPRDTAVREKPAHLHHGRPICSKLECFGDVARILVRLESAVGLASVTRRNVRERRNTALNRPALRIGSSFRG